MENMSDKWQRQMYIVDIHVVVAECGGAKPTSHATQEK